MDTRRAVSLMMRSKMLNAEQFEEVRQILRDIDSLDNHTAFPLFDKINFLMDAAVGSSTSTRTRSSNLLRGQRRLLPPTLIASVYGMNFKFMPELDWSRWATRMRWAWMLTSA